MKTHHKIGLAAAGIFAAAGIGLCTAAVVMGVNSGELSGGFRNWIRSSRGGELRTEKPQASFDAESIHNLELDLQYADMKIVETDSKKITLVLSGDTGDITYRQQGSTLEISDESEWVISFLKGKGKDTALRLEIPKGMQFHETEIEIGTGQLEIGYLDTGELSLECGVGDIICSGMIRRDAEINCGVGSITMELDQKESDFNYEIECGVGSIQVGNMSFDGLGTEQSIENKAAQTMDLECGVGDISIRFQ